MFGKFLSLFRFWFYKLRYPFALQSERLGGFGMRCRLKIKGKLELGQQVHFGTDAYIDIQGVATLGSKGYYNDHVRIVCHQHIEIGSNVLVASGVSIYDHDHHVSFGENGNLNFDGYDCAPIRIGNNVWIGEKSIILKGVTIGDNVIVGAGSVVKHDIDSNWMAAGNPCRPIKPLNTSEKGG